MKQTNKMVLLIFSIISLIPNIIEYVETSQLPSVHSTDKIPGIVESVIEKYFQNCDLFAIEDYSSVNNFRTVNKLSDSSTVMQPKFTLLLHTYNDSRFVVAPRKHVQCSVVTFFLNGTYKLNQFEKLLTTDYHAPTRPQSDHYIFISLSENSNNLKNSRIIQKLKFRLLINSKTMTTGYTICIYCKSEIVSTFTINLVNTTSPREIFPDWTRNGQLHTLRVSSPTKYLFVVELEKVSEKEWRCKRGQNKYVLESVLPYYNFTYKIFPSPTNDSGKMLANGTWDGVIGDILSEKADLGLSTSYNFYRYPILGFSRGTRYIWATFILGQPHYSYSWEAIFWPFGWDLWLTIFVTLLAVILMFHAIQSLEISKDDCYLPAIRIAFVLVGKEIPYPKATPARLLLCVWLFSCLVLSTLYVSKIVGLLAFPVMQLQPKNFIQLVDRKFGYKWKMVGGGNLYAHFASSTNPVLKKVFDEMGSSMKAIDCFKLAIQRKHACITWKGTSDFVSYRNMTFLHGKSPLIAADEDKTLFVPLGFAMARNSILLPNFNKAIQMLVDSGQAGKWIDMDHQHLQIDKIRWQKSTGEYGNLGKDSGQDLLSLNNLIGVFYMFLFGSTVSVLGFTSEKLYSFCLSTSGIYLRNAIMGRLSSAYVLSKTLQKSVTFKKSQLNTKF